MPLLAELSQSSRDSFELGSSSPESRDDRLNSVKRGVFDVSIFFKSESDSKESRDDRLNSLKSCVFNLSFIFIGNENLKIENASFGRVKPIVPGFVRIGRRGEGIPGRLA